MDLLKETNEVQILEYDRNNEFMNPKNLLSIYEKGYNYRYNKEIEIDSKSYHLIDLFPNEENNEIIKISLTISKDENMVKKIEAFESNGAIYVYNVIKSKFNRRNLKFDFDTSKYENIYIIDLRVVLSIKINLSIFFLIISPTLSSISRDQRYNPACTFSPPHFFEKLFE